MITKELNRLEKQISSLEGASLEIRINPTSSIFEEIRTFISSKHIADREMLSSLQY